MQKVRAHSGHSESPARIQLLGSRHSDHTQHIVTVSAASAASVSAPATISECPDMCDFGY